jgi:dUTP pyrophosphatase
MNSIFAGFYLNIELFHSEAVMPKRAIQGDAGLDLFVCEKTVLSPDVLISAHTGIKIEFPEGYAAIIKEKSGLSLKEIEIKAGVIDHGYRGEVIVLAKNKSKDAVIFLAGQKIAQLLIFPVWTGEPVRIEKVNEDTARKDGRFGSTGR